MTKFAPPRQELIFRLILSILALALLVFALSQRSVSSAAGVEMVASAVLFFGGTIGWTLWRLFKSKAAVNNRSESRSSASDPSSRQ